MKFPHFFIQRPIFAIVLSVFMLIAGALAFFQLPLSEYPSVTPPTVQVSASYPGANPKVIADTVAAPLEQAINGVEGMLYMSSQMSADGRMVLTISFRQGTDPDIAQIQVQNRVSRALPRLPTEVQQIGVVTEKTSPDILMVVHIFAQGDRYDPLYVSNYAMLNVRDELSRLPGIASVTLGGEGEYAMRVWLDPTKVASRGLTASDVTAAIREQNVQVAAGSVGQQPNSSSAFEVSINAQGRLTTVEQFGDIVIKAGADGQVTRLRDVARLELGSDNYSLRSLLDDKNAVGMHIVMTPGANALDVSASVRATMARLQANFPEGIEYRIAYDPTVFVSASLKSVAMTLLEATVLVVLVVMLFLQTWRASIIPLVAVPISLVGTFALMYLFGFSLNTLSLFGLGSRHQNNARPHTRRSSIRLSILRTEGQHVRRPRPAGRPILPDATLRGALRHLCPDPLGRRHGRLRTACQSAWHRSGRPYGHRRHPQSRARRTCRQGHARGPHSLRLARHGHRQARGQYPDRSGASGLPQ